MDGRRMPAVRELPDWAIAIRGLDGKWAVAIVDARKLWPAGKWERPYFLWASLGTSELRPPASPNEINFEHAAAAERLDFAMQNLEAAVHQVEEWPEHAVPGAEL